MDWNRAITRNRDALQRIVAALFAMLRTPGDSDLSKVTVHDLGEGTFTLPRHIYAAILLILRPAESALRRLIIIAAQGLVLKPRLPRPLPSHLPAFPSNSALKTPAFALFDPLKRFSIDDFDTNDLPQFNLCYGDEGTFHTHQLIASDKPVDAAQLYARLRALRHALSDLPRQARRLARWQARRDLALAENRPTRITPIRPGLPPGWRQRSIHEIDEVLRECHGLA
ncbi:MAG: hypothetical protein WCC66_15225, partial [Rhizobiaceae bacterium]